MAQIYKVADLFAGVGGIRLGFKQAFGSQLKTVFISEIDKFAVQVYTDNFGNAPEVSGDITKIKIESVPDFDICLAGFPCQAFSRMGKGKGFSDPRGLLFTEIIRLCREKKPKVIFCENVKALVSHNNGRSFRAIRAAFERIGYEVFYEVVNSCRFGVPQGRERLYIVCFRRDISPDSFSVAGQDRIELNGGIEKILLPDSNVGKYVLSDRYMAFLERRREKNKAAGNGFGYRVREKGDIAGTLTCSDTSLDGNLIRYKDRFRKLAPRECARLQGFPDSFKLNLSDTQIYRLMGQTVTVPVVACIARNIKTALTGTAGEPGPSTAKSTSTRTAKAPRVRAVEATAPAQEAVVHRPASEPDTAADSSATVSGTRSFHSVCGQGRCCLKILGSTRPLPVQCKACIAAFRRYARRKWRH